MTLEIKGRGKYSKCAPRVFTEQELYMLAAILKSKVATEVSIAIGWKRTVRYIKKIR